MADRPPWIARNERDRRLMEEWVNELLDAEDKVEAERLYKLTCEMQSVEAVDTLGPIPKRKRKPKPQKYLLSFAIREAREGRIEGLKALFPKIAEFLHAPKKSRGAYTRRVRSEGPAQTAAEDVKRIRAIWQREYGKMNRAKDNGPFATEIAARRNDVKVDDVILRLKRDFSAS